MKRLLQKQIAVQLEVTQSYVSHYINGKVGCSLKTAEKLTELFGQDPLFWMKSSSEQRKAIIGNGNGKRQT